PAALGDGARAIADALAALESATDRRMRLETLELLEGREPGVLVVQVDDKPHRHQIVFQMIEEGTAAGLEIERPAERMLDEARPGTLRLHLPQFLEADAELDRLAAFGEAETVAEPLGQRAARTLADQYVFAHQRHAGRIVRPMAAVPLDAHVAGDDAGHGV